MTHIVLTEEQERIIEEAGGPVEARDSRGRSVARVLPLLASASATNSSAKENLPATDSTGPREKINGTDWEMWYEQLASCKLLKEGWNGYTAQAPSDQAILLAERFLDAMRASDVLPTRVAPSAMGGVAVTRKVGTRKVLVESYNDGRVFALFSDRGSEDLPVEEVKGDRTTFSAFITKMREFLDG
jgi:hypothetical protein